jgi:hypothetical protein
MNLNFLIIFLKNSKKNIFFNILEILLFFIIHSPFLKLPLNLSLFIKLFFISSMNFLIFILIYYF